MELFSNRPADVSLPESSVALLGVALTIGGLSLQGSLGITTMLTAVGVALIAGGTVYAATVARESIRLSLAFVTLVAAQLLAFSGTIRLIGGVAIGAMCVAAGYSRLGRE